MSHPEEVGEETVVEAAVEETVAPEPKLTKKRQYRELVFRKPVGKKFDISVSTDRVDEQTWDVLDSLCPNKRVLLQYSTGKDSCAAWLELVERGYDVVPVFKEAFPKLSFFEAPIAAHEDFFGREIVIIPHKALMLDRLHFFNSDSDLANFGLRLKDEILYRTISKSASKRYRRHSIDTLLDEYQCDVTVIGTKASDSLHRRTHFIVDGPYLPSERLFALTWRMKRNAPFSLMIEKGLPIPKYYIWLGRSPELILEHEFALIKKLYPDDYAYLCTFLTNLDVYVKQYEYNDTPKHVIKTPKIVLEAFNNGHPFV